MLCSKCCNNLTVVSYNMHGFNQGLSTVNELIVSKSPDVFMLQEHWLTPANLVYFEQSFTDYFAIGTSALAERVGQGPIFGRPYGGTMTLVRNELRSVTECVHCVDRYVIVRVGNLLLVNVYLPCSGTDNRLLIVEELLSDILSWRLKYNECRCLIGGDLNTDLDETCIISDYINNFVIENRLFRCDTLYPNVNKFTYANEALGHFRKLDYMICDFVDVDDFIIVDPNINFSDHLPIMVVCNCNYKLQVSSPIYNKSGADCVKHLRWDHADLLTYYHNTMSLLYPVYDDLVKFEKNENNFSNNQEFIDDVYNRTVAALQHCAKLSVPVHKQKFYKFWWSQEGDCLKQKAVDSNNQWKLAGRPRSGDIYRKRNADKRNYRKWLRERQQSETECYTNELHEALSRKSGNMFWKCWNAKFDKKLKPSRQIDGLTDEPLIATKFAEYFTKLCSSLNEEQNSRLYTTYNSMRADYCGLPYLACSRFDVEMVEKALSNLKRGKAASLDSLTAEHLQNSHPILLSVLAKLFNIMLLSGCVPFGFGLSYIVPLPKQSNVLGSDVHVEDFRGIAISPVISKLFEHCLLVEFADFFVTSDNQFGFKKGVSCAHAIYSVRKLVDYYVTAGSTVNVCTLDLSKAFDKMNHYGLFIKLMERQIPLQLLCILECWFSFCLSCVKWGSHLSYFFKLQTGVRQGGVLSPFLFAIYVDDLVKIIKAERIGCIFKFKCCSIFLYADDIILLAPTVYSLQRLVEICERELQNLDMTVNAKKSSCIRFGPRFDAPCKNLVTADGHTISWVTSCRYLGVFFSASRQFTCLFDKNKIAFYKSFNAIFGKIGRHSSEEVLLSLVKAKCMPVLMYGTEACPVNSTKMQSLDFTIAKIFIKIFHMTGQDLNIIRQYFGFATMKILLTSRKYKFLTKYCATENYICKLFAPDAQRELLQIGGGRP